MYFRYTLTLRMHLWTIPQWRLETSPSNLMNQSTRTQTRAMAKKTRYLYPSGKLILNIHGRNIYSPLFCIRIRPSDDVQAWNLSKPSGSSRSITLDPAYTKTQLTAPQEFRFDEILTGSDNRSCYNAVARNHVCAAMDGYNAVVFAYGEYHTNV
jgi:hypothetical protein